MVVVGQDKNAAKRDKQALCSILPIQFCPANLLFAYAAAQAAIKENSK